MKMRLDITRLIGALLLAAAASGCAGSAEMMFVTPGSFDYMSCDDLAAATRVTSKRERDLKELIDRAEQDSFGVFVAATAYRSDYLKARGDLMLLAEASQNKKCDAPGKP
jgi:hypothetical protein